MAWQHLRDDIAELFGELAEAETSAEFIRGDTLRCRCGRPLWVRPDGQYGSRCRPCLDKNLERARAWQRAHRKGRERLYPPRRCGCPHKGAHRQGCTSDERAHRNKHGGRYKRKLARACGCGLRGYHRKTCRYAPTTPPPTNRGHRWSKEEASAASQKGVARLKGSKRS